jgi:hypothetical protein
MSEYYDIDKKYLAGTTIDGVGSTLNNLQQSVAKPKTTTKEGLTINELYAKRNELKLDKNADFNAKVNDPNGYGYIESLPEVRSRNATDMINQEQSILAISAVAGVSLIVIGLLLSGRTD